MEICKSTLIAILTYFDLIYTCLIIISSYSDIRPTFLFWARGRPVALMRGANRPLLTKLIHQEVNMEINQETRSINGEVDLYSDKVIQVKSCSNWKYSISIKLKSIILVINKDRSISIVWWGSCRPWRWCNCKKYWNGKYRATVLTEWFATSAQRTRRRVCHELEGSKEWW